MLQDLLPKQVWLEIVFFSILVILLNITARLNEISNSFLYRIRRADQKQRGSIYPPNECQN